jgi:hypothetical protein
VSFKAGTGGREALDIRGMIPRTFSCEIARDFFLPGEERIMNDFKKAAVRIYDDAKKEKRLIEGRTLDEIKRIARATRA